MLVTVNRKWYFSRHRLNSLRDLGGKGLGGGGDGAT